MLDDLKRGLQDLLSKRANLFESEAKPLIDIAATRALTAEELAKDADIEAAFKRFDHGIAQLREQIQMETQRASLGLDGGSQGQRSGIEQTLRSVLVERTQMGADLTFTSAEFKRALGTATTSDGAGNTIPSTFWTEFVQPLRDTVSVIDAGARVIVTTSGETIKVPRLKTYGAAESGKAANAQLGGTDPTFDQVDWTTSKYDQVILSPRELIEDSAIDIEGLIGALIGQNVGVKMGAAVSAAVATAATVGVTGLATKFVPTFDELVDLEHSVLKVYRKGAKWLANDTVVAGLRKIKDDNGQYIWQPSVREDEPDRLHGKPLVTDAFLDAPAADKLPLLFGDFQRGVWVRLVGSLRIERSDQAAFVNDQIAFKGVLRGGSANVDANAVKAYKSGAAS